MRGALSVTAHVMQAKTTAFGMTTFRRKRHNDDEIHAKYPGRAIKLRLDDYGAVQFRKTSPKGCLFKRRVRHSCRVPSENQGETLVPKLHIGKLGAQSRWLTIRSNNEVEEGNETNFGGRGVGLYP